MGHAMRRCGWFLAAGMALLVPSAADATSIDDGTTSSSPTVTVFNFTTGLSTHDALVSMQSNGSSWICGGVTDVVQLSTGHPRYQQMHDALVGLSLSRQKYVIKYQLVSNVCWLKQIVFQVN